MHFDNTGATCTPDPDCLKRLNTKLPATSAHWDLAVMHTTGLVEVTDETTNTGKSGGQPPAS